MSYPREFPRPRSVSPEDLSKAIRDARKALATANRDVETSPDPESLRINEDGRAFARGYLKALTDLDKKAYA